jgi:tripartite-type tricarboxylate transporter receptor subunit TctC
MSVKTIIPLKSFPGRLLGATFALAATVAGAQPAYPVKPVRLIVTSSPGGGTDTTARFIAPKLSELLGQPVVIDNRPGASTMIGMEAAARSAPDGYTLVLENSTMAILPTMKKNVRMDVLRGFAPVSLVASNPQLLISHTALPTQNLKQLMALARSQPGKLDYASGGYGGNPHMCMELFLSMTRLKMVYVPYKSGNAGLTDVLAGQVPVMMASILSALPQARVGRLRAYGVTTAKRAAAAPEIPTIAEAGVPGYEATQWFGILVPAGTPPDIVTRLHAELVRALKDPDVKKRFTSDGSDAVWSSSPEQFAAYIRADEAKWAKVAKAAGLQPQ